MLMRSRTITEKLDKPMLIVLKPDVPLDTRIPGFTRESSGKAVNGGWILYGRLKDGYINFVRQLKEVDRVEPI